MRRRSDRLEYGWMDGKSNYRVRICLWYGETGATNEQTEALALTVQCSQFSVLTSLTACACGSVVFADYYFIKGGLRHPAPVPLKHQEKS